MDTLGALEIQLLADVARLRADMEQAKGIVGGAAGAMQSAVAGLGKAFAALGVGISAAGMARWVRDAIDAADSASKLAQSIGVSVDKVAGLKLAFEQSGAGGADAMQRAMSRLSEQIVAGNKALAAMGITTRDAREALGQMADRFAGMADGSAKTAAAVEVFGARLGAQMIPLLNQGSKGLEEMDQLARQLGLTIDQETGRRAELFNDTLDSLGQATKGIATQVASQLLPTLNALAGSVLQSATEGERLQRVADTIAAGLKSLFSVAAVGVEVFNTLGKTFGSVAAAAWQAVQGNWRAAHEALQAGGEDIVAGWKDTAATIVDVWTGSASAVAEKSAEMAAQQRLAAQAAAELEKKLLAQSEAAKKAAAEARRLADAEADMLSKRGLAQLRRQDEAEAEAERVTLERIKAEQDWLSQRSLQQMRMYDEAEAAAQRVAQAEIDAQVQANAQILADWQRTVDQMGQSLADALMSGGKSVAEYLKGLFRQLVLRPILMPVATAISGGISGVANAATGGGAAGGAPGGGGLGSALSLFSSIGSFGTSAGVGAQAVMAGASIFDVLSGAGAMIGQGTLGSVLNGLGMAAGALGPIAAAATAIYGLYTMFKHERTPHTGGAALSTSGFGTQATWQEVTGRGPRRFDVSAQATEGMIATSRTVAQILQPLADLTGAGQVVVGTAYADDKSKDDAWGALRILAGSQALASWGGTRMFKDGEAGYKEFIAAVAESTRDAIGKLDLPGWAKKIAATLPDGATLDDIAKVTEAIAAMGAAIRLTAETLNPLGGIFSRIATSSQDARAALIELAGGADALAARSLAFVQNYYSRDEIAGVKARDISDTLRAAGITRDFSTTAELRRYLEAQDPNTAAGRRRIDALLRVAPDFAAVAEYMAEAGTPDTLRGTAALAPQSAILQAAVTQGASAQVSATNGTTLAVNTSNALLRRIRDLLEKQADKPQAVVVVNGGEVNGGAVGTHYSVGFEGT